MLAFLKQYVKENCDIDPENAKHTFAEGVTIQMIFDDYKAVHQEESVCLSYFHDLFRKHFSEDTSFQRRVILTMISLYFFY